MSREYDVELARKHVADLREVISRVMVDSPLLVDLYCGIIDIIDRQLAKMGDDEE